MTDTQTLLDTMEAAGAERRARRRFLRLCGGAAAITGGAALLSACGSDDGDNDSGNGTTPAPTPTPSTNVDVDVLNFALQLEYLEANYYYKAAFGSGLSADLVTGVGTIGTVTGGAAVTFTDTAVRNLAREIAYDEVAHITFLRSALGGQSTAMPAINIAGDATGAFTAAARAAGVVGPNDVFNPYANDESFLLGAYLLSDVGVSAYRGAARLLTNKTFLEASAGILAAEAYHDAAIRGNLYAKGLTRSDLRTNTVKISDARDALDGSTDLDQPVVGTDGTSANIVPTDSNGLVLGRTAAQVLNVVYLNKSAVKAGGFFPSGVNGSIFQSGAN
ncbi:Ferritin-like domain-containing protein [Sphingomonas gellani]|uniref:Ferritin-like domain-containing protein n=1 Tax=Sphingomonas gellani TaxID=1166340 RepID=A0A1H8HLW8_9SPHN|nr:ferritin-like domain-containing protein [Sphingomonas gellani]SEN57074.1 Ferritin-like domain-containing protein [Sphingomonas gellani]